MKTYIAFPFLIILFSLLTSCQPKQSMDQSMADDHRRKEILTSVAHHPAYASEMMQLMMTSDSGRHTMAESMMRNPDMMPMMMDHMIAMSNQDSMMGKMMMGKTMEMCDANESMCKMMMGSMQSHPNVMKSMKGMCDMNNMNMEAKNDPTHDHDKK